MKYDFLAPRQIVFGWGQRTQAGALAATLGRRAWVVCGSRSLSASGLLDPIYDSLTAAGVKHAHLANISREPLVDDVNQALAKLNRSPAIAGDFVLAIGGGSAIDLAKAVAALATQPQPSVVQDYLEGVGRGLTIDQTPLPLMVMPTTAGTGSEATKNAVISSTQPPFKKSLRSDRMVPSVVLIDPELTVGVPPAITAQTGMDAITQLIESYISCRRQPLPQALAIDGLRYALPAIELAVEDGRNRGAREAMSHAALLSGLALANSGLGLAHGVAAALGVHCSVPHGLACAMMLPATLRANRAVSCARLAELARAVLYEGSGDDTHWPRSTAGDEAAADAFVVAIEQLAARLGIPQRLSELGVSRQQLPTLAAASRGNSLSGNPRPIEQAELLTILEGLL